MKLGYLDEFKITNIKFDKHIIDTDTDSDLKLLLKKPNIKKCILTIMVYKIIFINLAS